VRILHVVPSYLPAWRYGGPIRSVHGLARAQAAAGHRVEVFTTDADGPGRLDAPNDRAVDRDGVAVHYFRLGRPARLYRSPPLGEAVTARIAEFDVAHLHSVFLWPTLAAARAAERARVPYVVAPRGMLVESLIDRRGRWRKRAWIALFERRTLSRAGAIHVTSASEARDLRRLALDLAPVAEVENGLDPDFDPEPEGAGDAERVAAARAAGPYLLCLGRVAAKKRIELAIAAVAGHPTLRLVVAGNDDEGLTPALEVRARELGISGRVSFLGEIRGAAKRDLLAHAIALALPSASENFGNVVLESLAAGRPVLLSADVGAAELVERAAAGRILGDAPATWSAAVAELLADGPGADAMGRRGLELVRRELSWERIAARMTTVYEAAIARGRGERG
jgi:glycosyltransferase involved in cell wall biosynthesis